VTFTGFNIDNPGGVSGTVSIQVITQPLFYVSANSLSPTAPFSSWATAATNIQDAVDLAGEVGSLVLVSNGTYNVSGRVVPPFGLTNRLVVTNRIVVKSVNGQAATVIQGYQVPGTTNGASAVRCVWLGDGTALIGFTVAGGGTLTNGDATNELSGGGVFCATTNVAISNCLISGNAAGVAGGGSYRGTFQCCSVVSNFASQAGGGNFAGVLENCILAANVAGSGGGAYGSALSGCTVVSNYCSVFGGSGGVMFGRANNSIVYYNTAFSAPSGYNYSQSTLTSCCTVPLPATSGAFSGASNITGAPLFVGLVNGNFRLQSNSPCINAGNNAYVIGTTDLDGNARISRGTVDMGAYEYQNPTSIISYAWLQEYGLPTDGSADYADTDHTGMNNWQKWVAGLNPTNSASVLQLMAPAGTGTNLVITWQSVTNINYFLARSASLAPGSFQTIVTNIAGQAGTTSYTDTNAPAPGPWFYRVGVP
jgi:hypothetical protein